MITENYKSNYSEGSKSTVKLHTIDHADIHDINNEIYGIMHDYCVMICKGDKQLAQEVLHQSIIRFYDYQSRHERITLTGGIMALIFRSVKLDIYRSIKPTTDTTVLTGFTDDSDDTYEEKMVIEEKHKMINDILLTLPEYQQHLFIYSNTLPSTIIAEVTGGNLTKIRQEINNIKKYIKTKLKQNGK